VDLFSLPTRFSHMGETFEAVLKLWTGYLASGVEGVAGLLIALAAIRATIQAIVLFLRNELPGHSQGPQTEGIRLHFARWLALALEFELGADILRTAIAPTWSDIGQLAAIATIRTLLNYFLQKEIDRAIERYPEMMPRMPLPEKDEKGNGIARSGNDVLH
jgi:uncharacterized membrane protein